MCARHCAGLREAKRGEQRFLTLVSVRFKSTVLGPGTLVPRGHLALTGDILGCQN